MNNPTDRWHRRTLLRNRVLAGAAGLVGFDSERAFGKPPPETDWRFL
jgi:hypothetical protein